MTGVEKKVESCEPAFSCRMCGRCCYGQGGITLEPGELERIAAFLGMDTREFRESCCEPRYGGLSIRSDDEGKCLFFEEGEGCRIHPVKPGRCSLWPFYPALMKDPVAWSEAMDACPGINRNCSHEDFVRQGRDEGDKTVA
jgi:uncharacterized protein